MTTGVTDSEFNMWRAVFAFSLVDNVLSLQEQELLGSYKSQVPFSVEQLKILGRDFSQKQDVEEIYSHISDKEDKKRFCVFARAVAWSDGKIDEQEAEILRRVACMKRPEAQEILKATRNHPHIEEYYNQYAKTGVIGLFETPHILEIQA